MIVVFLILRHRKVRIFRFSKAPNPLTKLDKLKAVIGSPVFIMFVLLAIVFKLL